MTRETEERFDIVPYEQKNSFYDASFGYRQDSRFSKKTYE